MKADEWDALGTPAELLWAARDRVSLRKAILFWAAGWRREWDRLPNPQFREVIEAAERFADGHGSRRALEAAARAATTNQTDAAGRFSYQFVYLGDALGFVAGTTDPDVILERSVNSFAGALWTLPQPDRHRDVCSLVREVLGNPFRPSVLSAACLGWERSMVPTLARSVYAERAFDRLPVLADMLEEAGCTDAFLLAHCRQPDRHVKGCWALDAILGLA